MTGTDDMDNVIMFFDADSIESIRGVSARDVAIIPHIHNLQGKCLKNRYGTSCDDMVSVPENLIEDISYHLKCYNNTRDRANAGHHLIELFNKVGDLSTWHSGYDEDHGTLPWEREE